jgi:8-oxo-dGTP pyrophosphatase MutT (NUDIX family)
MPGFEMVETREFATIPDKMRFPQILPVLYDELNKWLGYDSVIDEYWDVLDENRNPTGRKHRRIDDMLPGDYHLVVRAWILNSKREFLITRRAFNKIGFPGMWEVPSGSATAGEESLEAVIREAKEECGLVLLPENAKMFSSYRRHNSFYDNWLFKQDFALTDVVLQEGETIEARAISWNGIAAMIEKDEFIGRDVFSEFDLLEGIR